VTRSRLALALLPALACAALPPCPREGGPAWSEWATPHLRLLTDLGEEDGEETADALEELRASLVAVAWRGLPEPPRPLVVVVFRSAREMAAFTPARYEGLFMAGGISDGLIVSYASGSSGDRETLRHELAHALSAQFGIGDRAPRWLHEGLAVYLERVAHDERGRVVFGDADPVMSRVLHAGGPASFEELWQAPRPEDAGAFYATSWLLVHYLLNHQAGPFEAFQRAIISGREPRHAWNELVAPKVGDIDDALAAHLRRGTFTKYGLRPPKAAFSLSQRVLGDGEVHGVRAMLRAELPPAGPESRAAIATEVAEALRQDPWELRALGVERFHLGRCQHDPRVAEQLAGRHPDQPLAWLFLADARLASGDPAGARAALEKARALGYRGRDDVPEIVAPVRPH
jgi:hypothetical protein